MKDYIVIHEHTTFKLEKMVNKCLLEGYEPYGNLIVEHYTEGLDEEGDPKPFTSYYQAMISPDKEASAILYQARNAQKEEAE